MSSNLDIIAILYPKEGKVQRVVELLQEVSQYIKDNEPGTLKYEIIQQINKKSGVEEVIMLESYKDQAALGTHGSSDAFKKFNKTLKNEDLMQAPMQLKFGKRMGGFSRL